MKKQSVEEMKAMIIENTENVFLCGFCEDGHCTSSYDIGEVNRNFCENQCPVSKEDFRNLSGLYLEKLNELVELVNIRSSVEST